MTAPAKNAWYYRRWLIFSSFAYACAQLAYLSHFGVHDSELHQLIAEGCLWIIAVDLLVYVTGASADDLIALRLGQQRVPKTRAEDKTP